MALNTKLILVALAFAGLMAEAEDLPVEVTVIGRGVNADDESFQMPASVEVFDAAAIEASRARDLPEFLSKSANLHIRTFNANPLQAQIAMGGFGENSFGRVKVIVDSEELNPVDQTAPDLSTIPFENVTRVEIIHGPSAVLYGDSAEAGVVRISTEPLDYTSSTQFSAKVGSFGRAGIGASTRGGFIDEGVRHSATYRYERADGYRRRSGYDLNSFAASLRRDFDNDSSIGLKVDHANAFYQLPGALSWEEWRDDPRQEKYEDDWCRTWNYALALGSKLVIDDERFLRLDGTFSVKHRASHWGDYHYENDYDLYSGQFSPRYVDVRAIGGYNNQFTLGLDLRYDYYSVRDRSGLNNPEYYFTRTRGGAFAFDEFALLDRLSLVAGVRFEGIGNRWTHYQGIAKNHSTDFAVDEELAIVYRPCNGTKLYLKGSRFHRSAFCDEMNYTEDGKLLKPERGTSLDLGVSMHCFDAFKAEACSYWRWLDDEIFYNPHVADFGGGTWGGYNCNSPGRTERRGIDLSVLWRRERTAEASFRADLVDARFTSGNYSQSRIPLVPEVRLRAEVGIWLGDDIEVKGGYRLISAEFLAGDYENDADQLSVASLFDVSLAYAPSWAEGWKATLVVDNLFDRAYCDFAGWSDYIGAYYYPAAGRSFMFTISYTW